MSGSDKRSKMEAGEVANVTGLVQVAPEAIVSRVIAKNRGGSVTLFAFAVGQELSEHTAPFDALVHVVDGRLDLTIGGEPMTAGRGEMVLMPAGVPHALRAPENTIMILTMLRDPEEG